MSDSPTLALLRLYNYASCSCSLFSSITSYSFSSHSFCFSSLFIPSHWSPFYFYFSFILLISSLSPSSRFLNLLYFSPLPVSNFLLSCFFSFLSFCFSYYFVSRFLSSFNLFLFLLLVFPLPPPLHFFSYQMRLKTSQPLPLIPLVVHNHFRFYLQYFTASHYIKRSHCPPIPLSSSSLSEKNKC